MERLAILGVITMLFFTFTALLTGILWLEVCWMFSVVACLAIVVVGDTIPSINKAKAKANKGKE